jgi:hypothetical protein
MNPNDASNLDFLLTVSPATLADWFKQAESDDIAYATELLTRAQTEVEMMSIDFIDGEAAEDQSLAATYLSKFRL